MKLIKSHYIGKLPGMPEAEIVLREKHTGDEWVTHYYNIELGGYSHGHYFFSLEEAEKDFQERIEPYLDN